MPPNSKDNVSAEVYESSSGGETEASSLSKSSSSSSSSESSLEQDALKLQQQKEAAAVAVKKLQDNKNINQKTVVRNVKHSKVGPQSLKERSRIPPSNYMLVFVTVAFQYTGGIYSLDVLQRWCNSMSIAIVKSRELLRYIHDVYSHLFYRLMQDSRQMQQEQLYTLREILSATVGTFFVASTLYVLIWAPLRAGMWTGRRAKRHVMHRYLGLLYLVQYYCAWIELTTLYDQGGSDSYLSHFIALNGAIQGLSAYYSFKVLPNLTDPGYYSDKSVLSRAFVHENLFFSLHCIFGSSYYNDIIRTNIQSHVVGRILEHIFVFWPFILVRPWFPITRFSNAGTNSSGRTQRNQTFYIVGTKMVKFFYLWAKYYLGYYVNFLIYLNVATPSNMFVIRGLFLLNCGTVSISVFLHTLRFKKVLPPVLTFSLYLGQIYATFMTIPFAYEIFTRHIRLCLLLALGILMNLTRNRYLHGVWCAICVYLLNATSIEW